MAKGIIVVDLPKSCRNIRGDENGCPFGGMVCQVKQKDVMNHVVKGTKPDWCPIHEIPKRKPTYMSMCINSKECYENRGYNSCLDEIEGR